MIWLRLAWDRATARLFVTLVVVLGVIIGSAVSETIIGITESAGKTLVETGRAADLVIGPVEDPRLLVLQGLFLIGGSSAQIPAYVAEELRDDPRVAQVVPYILGGNVRGFPIVGTTRNHPALAGSDVLADFLETNDRVAVVGSVVARSLRLKIGDKILSAHEALEGNAGKPLTVAAVRRTHGDPWDRAVFVPLPVARTHHAFQGEKTLSGLLVRCATPRELLGLESDLRKRFSVGTAFPALEVRVIRKLWGDFESVFEGVAFLVFFLSLLSLVVMVTTGFRNRRRELAILRAIGFSRFEIILSSVAETTLLTGVGGVIGTGIAFAGSFFLGPLLTAGWGIPVMPLSAGTMIMGCLIVSSAGAVIGLLLAVPLLRCEISVILSDPLQ
ncbi:MAG: FtsX-like permease family protein [Candidatus Hydrogenedentota bacterium]|nr:MAG: FtsX-like permease family protein [Candidatus Hydrogenedentota bacterium]